MSGLDSFEAHLARKIRVYRGSPQVADLLDYHFGYGAYEPGRRGKRLRPRVLLAVAAAEGGRAEGALDAAVAIELLHNYSLIHDDIEDHDELRHGRPTLWARFGVPEALNAGDAVCALSFRVLTDAAEHHDDARVLRLARVLHEAHATMCDGQALDLAFERADRVGRDEYERMIGEKTAALFAAACEMGALCAPCDDERVAAYRRLGRAYGLAFQIRDDTLGIWASADATGKVVANDIARRKWTFPVVWALSGPPSTQRECIAAAYARGAAIGRREVEEVTAALGELGAHEAANAAVEEHLRVVENHPVESVRALLLRSLDFAAR